MTDKELLEYAAKAAGWIYYPSYEIDTKCGKAGWLDPTTGHVYWEDLWNPLTDDGAALRLAVTLHLPVEAMIAFVAEREPDWHKDPYAATRRAITRAAAEIGRKL